MERRRRSEWALWAGLAAVLILAAGLRAFRLDGQSMWADEGTSVVLAGRSLAAITRGAAGDIHPPLYYYLLHFWTGAFGTGVIAVRGMSVVVGVLLVAATFELGRRLFDARVGLAAALLSAISPFQVYYSQEARMYILVALLGAASALAMIWLLERMKEGRSALLPAAMYAAAAAGCLYSHYFGFTALLAQNLGFLIWLWGRRSRLRPLATWALIQAAVAAAFAPWLATTLGQLRSWPAVSEGFGAAELAWQALTVFSLGLSAGASWLGLGLGAFLGSVALGLVAWWTREAKWRPSGFPRLLALLWLAVPLVVMYVLSRERPMYNPKFVLLATPAYLLLAARGWTAAAELRAWRPAGPALAGLLGLGIAVASAQALGAYYFDPDYARDDYRAIARYIEAAGGEGDAILLNAPGQAEIFSYYYSGHLPAYPMPRGRPLDPELTRQELEDLMERYAGGRLFAVLWATDESDPGRFIETWLDEHAYKASDVWHGNVRLASYALPEAGVAGGPERRVDARLGDGVMLEGYTLLTPRVRSGEVAQLRLYWRAEGELGRRYKVFVHLLDEGGKLVGQRDAEPGGGARITTTWQPGEQVQDNYGVPVEPGTPPGAAIVEAGMYDLETGQRLPVTIEGAPAGDRILLGRVEIERAAAPPPLEALKMEARSGARLGPLVLLGYDLCRLGHPCEGEEAFHPGDVAHLILYWRAEAVASQEPAFSLQVVDGQGRAVVAMKSSPAEGRYPVSEWRAGEIVRDQYHLFLPQDLASGEYRLCLEPTGGQPGGTTIDSFRVEPGA